MAQLMRVASSNMHDMPELVSVSRHILAIYGTDQDDSGSPSAYLEARPVVALRHARTPLDIYRNRAYFIGIDSLVASSGSSWLQMTAMRISGTPSMPCKPAIGRTGEI